MINVAHYIGTFIMYVYYADRAAVTDLKLDGRTDLPMEGIGRL